MKRDELIAKLLELPADADIYIMQCDDILGYYDFTDPMFSETKAVQKENGYLSATYSNGPSRGCKTVTIWEIE